MPKFLVHVSWAELGSFIVEADDEDKATELAQDMPLPDGEYLDSSFEIDLVEELED